MSGHDEHAAERVAAYLDQHQAWMHQIGRPGDGVIAIMEVVGGIELSVGDLRAVLREHDEARTQLAALKPVWESRYSDATYTTKQAALTAAENDGYSHEGDAAVCWRLAGPWHDGATEPPQSPAAGTTRHDDGSD